MKAGIYTDISAADYFADPCDAPSLTQSIAKILLDKSPAHARLQHPKLNPDYVADDGTYDKARAIGNAAHKLTLGRGKEVCIIEAQDFRTNAAKETRDQAIADGTMPILAKHYSTAKAMSAAMRGQIDAAGCTTAFKDGNGEVVIAWEEDGLWMRALVDWVCTPILLYDIKTSSRSAAPHGVPSYMVESGWPIQAAMQERGLDVLDPAGAGRRTFRFVMVENEPPYALTIHEMSEAVMTMGRKQLYHAIAIWRRCMTTGEWPAYPPIINRPEYPGYAEQRWLTRELSEADKPRSGEYLRAG